VVEDAHFYTFLHKLKIHSKNAKKLPVDTGRILKK
jgi:hypothetical protein